MCFLEKYKEIGSSVEDACRGMVEGLCTTEGKSFGEVLEALMVRKGWREDRKMYQEAGVHVDRNDQGNFWNRNFYIALKSSNQQSKKI